jgi:dTDP-4-dehydrorhamnose 3,5-epimerase
MNFTETRLPNAFVIDPEPYVDERGLFARTFCAEEFGRHGLATAFVQTSLSVNSKRGTLRGLHYQATPHEEAKLVRCVRGAIYDVIVDLRPESNTYLEWIGAELTADNHRMVYVPEGFAHGFQTLADDTDVFYQMSEFYAPGSARGIRWDDPALGVGWPATEQRVISAKDLGWPAFVPEQVRESDRSGGEILRRAHVRTGH